MLVSAEGYAAVGCSVDAHSLWVVDSAGWTADYSVLSGDLVREVLEGE